MSSVSDNDEFWPTVVPNDSGIRPAGPADECLYCRSKIGDLHARDCVVVHKKVKVRYEYEIDIEVPYFWTKEDIEFHRNDSSWCASNSVNDIKRYQEMKDEECLCDEFKCKVIGDSDTTPTRELFTDEHVAENDTMRNKVK